MRVEPAISVASQGRTQEKPWEDRAVEGAEKAALSPAGSGSPHTSSGGDSEKDSGNDRPAPGLSPSQRPGISTSACSRSPEEEEEDVFKYVREIFFS